MRLGLGFVGLAFVISASTTGCTKDGPAPSSVDAGADAGAVVEIALEVSATGQLLDGGTVLLPLNATDQAQVEPLLGMTVEANLPLTDYRIRVFDESDRAVVSDDEILNGPSPVTYRILFPTPLANGYEYELVIDAQTGDGLVDARGKAHPDVRLGFQILGEKQKPPPPPRKRRR